MDVAIHMVSRRLLGNMTTPEKIRFILDEVKAHRVVVLEQGLDPREEAKLIETTMQEIEPGGFAGIELRSQREEAPRNLLERLAVTFRRPGVTVVGPADAVRWES